VNVLFITIDSLNRHFLPAYGQPVELKVPTPNLDAFSRRAATFDRHFVGSLPCMPARREFLAGIHEMLWRSWGPMEPFDQPIARIARNAGFVTHLVSDHYHYWHYGSGGYFEDYHTYDFIRGHEHDPWRAFPRDFSPLDLARVGIDAERARDLRAHLNRVQYLRNVAGFSREEDFFAPKVFSSAADWLTAAASHLEHWFLHVDSFEVHEPFHVPEPYRSLFTDEVHSDPELLWWPHYGSIYAEPSRLTERQVAYVRSQYAGKLAMVDRWFGRILDVLDDQGLWDQTMVIVTSDHGHYLGEKGWIGKPFCPPYNTIAQTPLFIWDPAGSHNGLRIDALTQAVDIYATVLGALGCAIPVSTHSRSLLPLLRSETVTHRDWALYGYFGRSTAVTDGRYTLMRAPKPLDEAPLYTYSTHMISQGPFGPPPARRDVESGRFLPYTDMPGWRYTTIDGGPAYFRIPSSYERQDLLFDLSVDPDQNLDLVATAGPALDRMTALLRRSFDELHAPDEQYQRLRL
jgi:arylsulfatase A-like enzyme